MGFEVLHSKILPDKKANHEKVLELYNKFRDNKFKILICTDILARGIDIDKVGLVINIFAPRTNCADSNSDINAATYMHRIARTGRYVK
mmetsp:Transcript_5012/g.748  ORF Transcript_5012/g.748 Transcript_5012/m.748 type:complete len:89 (+) Transcript_5012:57-323(+)